MIGRTLSHYRIEQELGAGGMGVVYRARDTLLERFVALKILPNEAVSDDGRRRRFLQEARAASALNHPGIITIHDILHEGGTDAIVMELVDGTSLQHRLEDGALPLSQALSIARQIADALGAAHTAGIVHRDLKPANVMVTARGHVKVLDFGIAKLDPMRTATDDGTHTAPLTVMGTILGTAAYMSPEQARGEAVDARTDVFALGVVLYEMLTGRSPFAAATLTAVLHKLIYEEPAVLSTYDRSLPPAVQMVVDRALAKRPDERFASMGAMAAALETLIAGGVPNPVREAAPPSPAGRSVRVPLSTGAAMLAVVVAYGAWSMAPSEVAPTDDGAGSAALPSTPFDAYAQGQQLLARYDKDGYIDASITRFRHAIGLSPRYPPAYAGLGMAFWRKYREQRDPMHLSHATENALKAVELDPQLSVALAALAFVRIEAGELDAAEKLLADALNRDPGNADAFAAKAYLHLRRKQIPESLDAVRAAGRVRGDDWSLALMEGVIQLSSGAPADAVPPLERAAALAPDSALVYRNLGAAYHAVGNYADATESFQRALQIKPDAAVYNNLGTLLFFRGLYTEAVDAFNRAVELGANEYRSWGNLADSYRFVPGREEDARNAYTIALKLLDERRAQAPDDMDLATRRVVMLAKRGDCREAIPAADALVSTAATASLPLYRLGVAYEVCERRDEALDAVTRAVAGGYQIEQVQQDPELVRLRADPRFHRFLSTPRSSSPRDP